MKKLVAVVMVVMVVGCVFSAMAQDLSGVVIAIDRENNTFTVLGSDGYTYEYDLDGDYLIGDWVGIHEDWLEYLATFNEEKVLEWIAEYGIIGD